MKSITAAMSAEGTPKHITSVGVELGDTVSGLSAGARYGTNESSLDTEGRPSIQQLVTNLRESMKGVQARVSDTAFVEPVPVLIDQRPSSDDLFLHTEPVAEWSDMVLPKDHRQTTHQGLGYALSTAVLRAKGANRFDVVRDSVTGEPTEALMLPPDRPHAESKNVLTVSACPQS